jgi:hypothetical protein
MLDKNIFPYNLNASTQVRQTKTFLYFRILDPPENYLGDFLCGKMIYGE